MAASGNLTPDTPQSPKGSNGPILHDDKSGFPPISDEKFTTQMRVVDPLQTLSSFTAKV